MVNLIYMVGGEKHCRPLKNSKELMEACNSPENVKNWKLYREPGKDCYKKALVEVNYNCQASEGELLKGIRTLSPFFFYDVDCNNREECQRIMRLLLDMKDELGLVEVAESASYGVHAVGRRQAGRTVLECQVRISLLTKTEMDTNNKNNNRVVFHGPIDAETTPLLDEALFTERLTDEEAAAEFVRMKEREEQDLEEVPPGAKKANKHYRPWEEKTPLLSPEGEERKTPSPLPLNGENGQGIKKNEELTRTEDTKNNSQLSTLNSQLEYQGIPYSEIIAKWWELYNDGKEPVKSNRDVLTFELAVNLRHICGFDRELMDRIIPCYDEFPEAQKLKCIDSALGEKRTGMPNRLKQVLQALKSTSGVRACGGTPSTPPPMPKRLPPLIKLLTKNVPDQYKPAVANAVFPALGVHLHGVKFRYLDNVEHEATFMNVLIGRQSVGKGSIKKPIEFIMEDIRQRDIPNREREAEWKQKNPNARQKKDPRPTDICIQMLIDNLTDAVFNQRVVDANNNGERFIYTIVDEIDALKKVTSKGTTDEVGLLIRKAFDNSMAGQERWGADSVSGIAPLRWNFNASATPPNAKRFFYKMVNDGTMSRLDISTIIPTDDEEKIPVLGIYDHNFAAELKPYIDRLEAANGMIECPQAKRLAQQICQENYDTARLYESEAYRVFSYRANVIASLTGMVLYVVHGYKSDKSMADFMRWTEQYNLWCKMLYFGRQLEKELREEEDMQKQSGTQNLLELSHDEFTREEYRQMRFNQGRTGDGNATLRSWTKRGYIFFDEMTGKYCKTVKYKSKISNI